MKGINKAVILGRVGKDPEIRYAGNGNAIANFSVATSESWKDKQTGQKQEKTEWHRVSSFGKLAEIIGQYVKKGDAIYIEGKIQTRKWQDNNGQDRYTTEIVANEMQMLGSGNGGGQAPQPQPQQHPQPLMGHQGQHQQPHMQHPQQQPQQQPQPQMGKGQSFDDDIPF